MGRESSRGDAEALVERAGPGLFRVRGLEERELQVAAHLAIRIGEVRAVEAERRRPELYRAMVAHGIDPVPWETVAQARRLAESRNRLLGSGAHTTKSLRDLRGDSSSNVTRTWISRQRERHAVFTVEYEGQTLLPAFQLAADGTPRGSLQSALKILIPAGLGGWELWTWFVSRSPWLGGRAPEGLLDSAPERVVAAAGNFVANLA